METHAHSGRPPPSPAPSSPRPATPRQGGAAQSLLERMLEQVHAELVAPPPDRESDRRRLAELLAAAQASAGGDARTCGLVEDAAALWGTVCLKDDQYAGLLVSSVRRMQLDLKRIGRELQEELTRGLVPPSPASSVVRTKESLAEQLMISDDLAEMLAAKEAELEAALAEVEQLKSELEQAQLQASISARFSPESRRSSHAPPSPTPSSGARHSRDGRPRSGGSLNDSRASADVGRDEEVERALEEMATHERDRVALQRRVEELEQQVARHSGETREERAARERDSAAMQQRVADLEKENARIAARELRLSDDNDEVYHKLEALQQRYNSSSQEAETLRDNLACEHAVMAELRQALAERTSKEAQLQAVLAEMQERHEQVDAERAGARQVREQLATARDKISELSQLVKNKNEEMDSLHARLSASTIKPKVGAHRKVHWEDSDASPVAPSPPPQPQSWLAQQPAAAGPTLCRALPQTPTQGGTASRAEEDALQEVHLMKLKKMAAGKALARKMVLRWTRARLYQAWCCWLDTVDESESADQKAPPRAASSAAATPATFGAAFENLEEDIKREFQMLDGRLSVPATSGPQMWLQDQGQEVSLQHRRLVQMKKYKQRWRHMRARPPLASWVAACHEARRLRRLGGALRRRWRKLQLSMTFHEWWHEVQDEVRARGAAQIGRGRDDFPETLISYFLSAVTKRGTLRSMADSLDAWAAFATRAKRLARKIADSMLRRRKMALLTMSSTWQIHAGHVRRQRSLVRQVCLRIQGALAKKAWSAWEIHAWHVRRQRSLVRQACLRMQGALATRAWSAWESHAWHVRRQRNMVRQACLRMQGALTTNAWSTWEKHAWHVRRQRNLVRQACLRIQGTLATQAWSAWEDSVRCIKMRRGVIRKCVLRLRIVALGRMWANWEYTVTQAQRLRRAFSRILGRSSLSKLRLCWSTWRMSAAQTAEAMHDLASCSLHLSKRYVARMLRQSFESLRQGAAQQQSAIESALERWLRWTGQSAEAGARHNVRIWQVWQEWRLLVKHEFRLTSAASRVMRRWVKLAVSRALASWHCGAMEQKRLSVLMRKVTQRWCNKVLVLCYAHWWRQAHDQNLHVSLMFRAANKLRQISLGRAFDTWKSTSERIMTCNHACYQMVSRRVGREQTRWLRKWSVCTVENVRHKAAAIRIAGRCAAAVLWRYYNLWSHMYMEQRRLRQACMLIVLRWRTSVQLAAWSCWRQQYLDQKRLRQVCSKILLRWAKLQMFVPFRTWEAQAERQRRLMHTAKTIVLRWKKHGLCRAWNEWSLRTSCRKRTSDVCRKIVLRWSRMGIARAMDSWQYLHETRCRLKRKSAVISDLHARRTRAAAVGIWYHETTSARRLRVGSLRIFNKHDSVLTGSAMVAWQLLYRRNQVLRRTYLCIVTKHRSLDLRGSWAIWLQHLRTNRVHETVSERITIKWARRTLSTTWSAWCVWQHQAWVKRVSQSQNEMAHALGGSDIGKMMHESSRKDYQVHLYVSS